MDDQELLCCTLRSGTHRRNGIGTRSCTQWASQQHTLCTSPFGHFLLNCLGQRCAIIMNFNVLWPSFRNGRTIRGVRVSIHLNKLMVYVSLGTPPSYKKHFWVSAGTPLDLAIQSPIHFSKLFRPSGNSFESYQSPLGHRIHLKFVPFCHGIVPIPPLIEWWSKDIRKYFFKLMRVPCHSTMAAPHRHILRKPPNNNFPDIFTNRHGMFVLEFPEKFPLFVHRKEKPTVRMLSSAISWI